MNFPEYSDLGNKSDTQQASWMGQQALMERCRYYFDGDVFKEKVPDETGTGDAPLMYPVGINLVKMLCLAQTDAEFGEWDEDIVSFTTDREEKTDEASEAAIKILSRILRNSNGNTVLWQAGLERNIFGGSVIKVSPMLGAGNAPYIRWSRIDIRNFYPVFDPDDLDELLEATIITRLSAEQARLKYGYVTDKEYVTREEYWSRAEYSNKLDGHRIDAYSGINPWGAIPLVYTPRMRSTKSYGDPLAIDIFDAQDEMNARIADIGDGINYNSHPIRWGFNLPKRFNVDNFPMEANAMWDLGRQIGSSPPPEVGILEAKQSTEAPMAFVNFIYDWSRVSVFAPPIAFGEDSGGGQRSGDTLEIRMWPLVRALHRSRAYALSGYDRLIRLTGKILQQKRFPEVSSYAINRMIDGSIRPHMNEILPRDHQAVVDEVVKLLSTEPPSISIETAEKILGRGNGEVERIIAMLKNKEFYPEKEEKSNDVQEGMKGKMTPQTEAK